MDDVDGMGGADYADGMGGADDVDGMGGADDVDGMDRHGPARTAWTGMDRGGRA